MFFPLKIILCNHNYEQVAWKEKYDKQHNVRYSERLYVCSKCKKKIWVDGRNDPYKKEVIE